MKIPSEIKDSHDEMRQWRRQLHEYPETAYEEVQTSKFISEKLCDFGLDVFQGLAETGIVSTLSVGTAKKAIALRADMDALHIQEHNDFSYRSKNDGRMHACGHDGHSAMLLGAAKYLTQTRGFNGTVHFIFQPAEEGRAGAKRMLDEGLFEKFPAEHIFGMHNFPDIPQGHFAVKNGPMMASSDSFEIQLHGCATHAALPHLGKDAIIAAAQLINSLQTIISRNIDTDDAAVVSITQIHAGDTWNAIPEMVILRGTFRCYRVETQKYIEKRIRQQVESISQCFGIRAEISINPENPGYPVTVNTEQESEIAAQVAASIVGTENVDLQPVPSMGAEDFAFMLEQKPGCYIWIGNGSSRGSCLLHNPEYDFNDEILTVGAAYWAKLVETMLPQSSI